MKLLAKDLINKYVINGNNTSLRDRLIRLDAALNKLLNTRILPGEASIEYRVLVTVIDIIKGILNIWI